MIKEGLLISLLKSETFVLKNMQIVRFMIKWYYNKDNKKLKMSVLKTQVSLQGINDEFWWLHKWK